MSLEPPEKLQKLRAALHAKAKASPNQRFHALYDKVYRLGVVQNYGDPTQGGFGEPSGGAILRCFSSSASGSQTACQGDRHKLGLHPCEGVVQDCGEAVWKSTAMISGSTGSRRRRAC